jgi:serine/threonine-protein kinase RsbW/stage II sporulation protein AB (anti-sigma F factor)
VIGVLRGGFAGFAAAAGFTGAALDDVRACVSEAVTNAVVHAFRDGPPGTVSADVELTDRELLVRVSDDGIGFGPRHDSPGLGLGIPTIAAMSSAMTIDVSRTGGTEIRMAFARAPI